MEVGRRVVSTLAEVRMWGTTIGAVSMDGGRPAVFQYDPGFLAGGIEVSPLTMPLRAAAIQFPALNPESFHGLPGLSADSLPDRYGNALIDAWLAGQGRRPEELRRGRAALLRRPARHGRARVPARHWAAPSTRPRHPGRGAGRARLRGARRAARSSSRRWPRGIANRRCATSSASAPRRAARARRPSSPGTRRPARCAPGSSTPARALSTGC